MSACFLSCIRCHCKKINLAVVYCCKKDNTFAKLLFQFITQVSETVHVNALNFGCKEFYAVYFNDFIHDIAKCTLGSFALEGLIFAIKSLYLSLQVTDLFYNLGCIGL